VRKTQERGLKLIEFSFWAMFRV